MNKKNRTVGRVTDTDINFHCFVKLLFDARWLKIKQIFYNRSNSQCRSF